MDFLFYSLQYLEKALLLFQNNFFKHFFVCIYFRTLLWQQVYISYFSFLTVYSFTILYIVYFHQSQPLFSHFQRSLVLFIPFYAHSSTLHFHFQSHSFPSVLFYPRPLDATCTLAPLLKSWPSCPLIHFLLLWVL